MTIRVWPWASAGAKDMRTRRRMARILDGVERLPTHERSDNRGAPIETAGHTDALMRGYSTKREARHPRGIDPLARRRPVTRSRGRTGAIPASTHLLRLPDRYGAAQQQEALARDTAPHQNPV